MQFEAIHSESSDGFSDQSPTLAGGPPVQPLLEPNKSQTDMQFVNEDEVEALGAAAPPVPATEEPKPLAAGVGSTASKTESPKRKGAEAGAHLLLCECGALQIMVSLRKFRTQSRWKRNRDICHVQSVPFC